MSSKAILLFGSFNPITNAHISMGIRAKEIYPDADIIYIPAPCQYMKNWKGYDADDMLSDEERIFLLANSIFKYKDFSYDSIEIEHFATTHKVLTTFETLQKLKEKYYYSEYIICLGADKVEELELWNYGAELVKYNQFLIIERNYTKGKLPTNLRQYSDHFIYAGGDYPEVSSTQIRTAMKSNKLNEVEHLIPSFVYNYLKEKKNEL